MDSKGYYAYQNGASDQYNDMDRANRAASNNKHIQSSITVPTVDEALPYSPFASFVPFNSDIIPVPSIGLASSTSIFATPAEREEGNQGLSSLNYEHHELGDTSERLQRSLNHLKALLKPEGLARYEFKTAPRTMTNGSSNENAAPKPKLSAFAQMVLDGTSVEYNYASPPRPSPPILSGRAGSQNHATPTKYRSQANQSHVVTKHANDQYAEHRGSVPHPVQPRAKSNSNVAVVIPKLPNSFKQEQYKPPKPVKAIVKSEVTVDSPPKEQLRPQVSPPAQLDPKIEPSHPTPPPQSQASPNHSQPQVIIPSHTTPSQAQPRAIIPSPQSQSQPQVIIKSRPQVIIQSHSTPPYPTAQPQEPRAPSSFSSAIAVVIPDLHSNFRADEYEVVPDSPGTPLNLSKRRDRSDAYGYEDDLSRSVDQREKADTASRNLREYLQEIFEAEDRLQLDNLSLSHIFIQTSDGYSLSTITQTRIESLLQKIISVGRYSIAPLDDLLRLQNLCGGALKDAEMIDLKVDESMGESEVENWLQQTALAEVGVKAARTALRLMSGGRNEKQLYSEDTIQSALNVFKNVSESCIIPIVEMRSTGSSAATFKLLSIHKKSISNLLTHSRRLFALIATLVSSIELSETVINTLEFTASRLIFVENAHMERDSILGVSRFDSLRVTAMDVLAQIFLCNPVQRQGIFDEILTSLEKLPVTRQSARQFKLAEGGSIQLVSALIMRLIQTSASKADDSKDKRRIKALEALNGDEESEPAKENSTSRTTINSESRAELQIVTSIQELRDAVSPLLDTAKGNASYVVGFIVNRAMKSTKTGDAPYRNLLDLFVEDFITCLGSTDWPAAELLLRLFLFKMVSLAEGDKTPAPAKNMALDLLGLMGAAISELNSHVRKTAGSLESGDSELGKYLSRLTENSLEKNASPADIVSWNCGPFRVCLEYLEERFSSTEDPQLSSAIGFFMAEWASKISTTFDELNEDDYQHDRIEKEYGRLGYRLRMMITDRRWLSTEYSYESISAAHARLAYSLTLLNSQFCESFGRVLTILLGSMTSDQATVRSKSMKSVNQVLDTDPTIIDREPAVKILIMRCSGDTSVLVRDSALSLIGKCITLRPALEEEMIPSILQRVNDSGVGVRKRAMKLAKDIYLRNTKRDVRSSIADSLLHRVTDMDDTVQELARQTIEEVWMSPFYQPTSSDDTSAQYKLAMADHVALMVRTVQRGNGVATVLDKVLQNMLSIDAKNTKANFRVCRALVATMFETIIDNPAGEGNGAPSARDALQILSIFAKSNPMLFTAAQIQLLQPYIAHLGTTDDMAIYRLVVVIFRHVLPQLPKVHNEFLAAVRKELIPTVTRFGKTILDDVVACLWIISEVLEDFQHLTRLVLSSLNGISKMTKDELDDAGIRKVSKLLIITGVCGKHCNLDPSRDSFKKLFPKWDGVSVSKLMTDTFAPFAAPEKPMEVRKAAFDAIGMVCHSWPKNFSSANIYTAFLQVFDEKDQTLEAIVMRAFRDFLLLEEKRSEAGKEGLPGASNDPQAKLGVMGGGQGDGVAIGIAQRFLPPISHIALSRQDDQGLLATEVVASIARQGLVHPKETGLCLIALETSQNPKIVEIAFREHRAIHEKHETILEKEYMRAVHLAYVYQRDVVQNCNGATPNPFTSKLHLMVEVLRISKVKSRKRFYDNLCARIEFDPAKMDVEKDLPPHLEFCQFIIENLAFFEYATVDELMSTISAMEKVVAAMGTNIAHSIETEIFQISLDQSSQPQIDENGQPVPVQPPPIDQSRLTLLTASSMMLSSLWEARSYLRKQFGLTSNHQREKKVKGPSKDMNKAPVKAPFITGEKFWEEQRSTMAALDSDESMMKQCRAFVELLNVDQDFKVAAEGEEDAERTRLDTPSEDEERDTPGPPGSLRGRKRKAGGSTPSGRKKRQRSSSIGAGKRRGKSKGKRASTGESDDELGDSCQ